LPSYKIIENSEAAEVKYITQAIFFAVRSVINKWSEHIPPSWKNRFGSLFQTVLRIMLPNKHKPVDFYIQLIIIHVHTRFLYYYVIFMTMYALRQRF